jgi:hypothetical protein
MNKQIGFKTIFGVLLLTFAVNSFAQSIVDVARKERERQKASQSKVMVTGVGSSTAIDKPPTDEAKPGALNSTFAKPIEPTDNKGRTEKFWRAAFQQARDDAKRADAKAEVLDLRVKELNTQLLRESEVYNREYRLGPTIAAAQKDLEDARKQSAQAKQKITDLEDDLRKSGGPAGWAR